MEKATLVKPPGEVQPCESQLTLYELPMSPFSRIARFALAEKALEYRTVILDGMKGDVMEPEYVEKVNAKMLAPVLKVDGERVIPDSRDILHYLEDEAKLGVPLTAPEKRKEMWAFVDRVYEVPLQPLFFGFLKTNGMEGVVRSMMIDKPRAKLEALAAAHPHLKEAYDAKLKEVEARPSRLEKKAGEDAKAAMLGLYQKAEDRLAAPEHEGPFLFGSNMSVADIAFSTFAFMAANLGYPAEATPKAFPRTFAYLAAVRARPACKAAKVNAGLPLMMRVMMVPMGIVARVMRMLGRKD